MCLRVALCHKSGLVRIESVVGVVLHFEDLQASTCLLVVWRRDEIPCLVLEEWLHLLIHHFNPSWGLSPPSSWMHDDMLCSRSSRIGWLRSSIGWSDMVLLVSSWWAHPVHHTHCRVSEPIHFHLSLRTQAFWPYLWYPSLSLSATCFGRLVALVVYSTWLRLDLPPMWASVDHLPLHLCGT